MTSPLGSDASLQDLTQTRILLCCELSRVLADPEVFRKCQTGDQGAALPLFRYFLVSATSRDAPAGLLTRSRDATSSSLVIIARRPGVPQVNKLVKTVTNPDRARISARPVLYDYGNVPAWIRMTAYDDWVSKGLGVGKSTPYLNNECCSHIFRYASDYLSSRPGRVGRVTATIALSSSDTQRINP